MIHDAIKNWRAYRFGKAWEESFAFIETLSENTEDGEYSIRDKDIFARVMTYETKDISDGVFESHRQYVDIQTTLLGAEGMFWSPPDDLEIKSPYDEENDVIFYRHRSYYPSRLDVFPAFFALFFPHDVHMPQMIVSEKETIKKAVVKIKASLLSP